MTERDQIIARLMAGEVIFLPKADWQSVQKLGSSRLYADIKAMGRFLHFVTHVDEEGVEGLRVWVDEERGRGGAPQSRTQRLFADSRRLNR